jgi:DNA-binding NarL/FixJ family response regulator
MIKIGIAEDNSFLANSLINKIGLFDDCKVKIHAVDGEDLIAKLHTDSNVDIILMDIQMPNMNGIEATKIITNKYPQIKIIMLTIMDSEQAIYDSINAGAKGYLIKESKPKEIYDAIIQAVDGAAVMSPMIALKAMNIIRQPNNISVEKEEYGLSARELDVLVQLSKGLNQYEIGANLSISPNTVRKHTENIYKKLEVNNKAEALQIAYRNRLV